MATQDHGGATQQSGTKIVLGILGFMVGLILLLLLMKALIGN